MSKCMYLKVKADNYSFICATSKFYLLALPIMAFMVEFLKF